MIDLALKLLFAYLLGGIVGSLLLGKLKGVDIRTAGSGNAGATNALRTQGKGFAIGTALIDIGKGMLAVLVIARLPIGDSVVAPVDTQLCCALAAAVGHCYPLFHGFRGGKGAGTLIGAIAVIFPWVALEMLGVWLLVLMSCGYVGLATVIAGLSFPILLAATGVGTVSLGLAMSAAAFLAFTHRSNIERVIRGNENRFEKIRVIGRWFDR